MRLFCWVYQHRDTGERVLVQRPRRRAYEPTYHIQAVGKTQQIPSAEFRRNYRFVGHKRCVKAAILNT